MSSFFQKTVAYRGSTEEYEYPDGTRVLFTAKQRSKFDRFRELFNSDQMPPIAKRYNKTKVLIGLDFIVHTNGSIDGNEYASVDRYIKYVADQHEGRGLKLSPLALVVEVMYGNSDGLVNYTGLDFIRKHLLLHLLGMKTGSRLGGDHNIDELLRTRISRVRKYAQNAPLCKYTDPRIKEILTGNKDEKEGIKTMSPAEGSQTREKSMAAAKKSTVGKIETLKVNALELASRTKDEALEGVWGMGANVGVGAINRFLLAGVRRSPLSEGTKKDAEWLLQHPLAEAVTTGGAIEISDASSREGRSRSKGEVGVKPIGGATLRKRSAAEQKAHLASVEERFKQAVDFAVAQGYAPSDYWNCYWSENDKQWLREPWATKVDVIGAFLLKEQPEEGIPVDEEPSVYTVIAVAVGAIPSEILSFVHGFNNEPKSSRFEAWWDMGERVRKYYDEQYSRKK